MLLYFLVLKNWYKGACIMLSCIGEMKLAALAFLSVCRSPLFLDVEMMNWINVHSEKSLDWPTYLVALLVLLVSDCSMTHWSDDHRILSISHRDVIVRCRSGSSLYTGCFIFVSTFVFTTGA